MVSTGVYPWSKWVLPLSHGESLPCTGGPTRERRVSGADSGQMEHLYRNRTLPGRSDPADSDDTTEGLGPRRVRSRWWLDTPNDSKAQSVKPLS